MFGDEVTVSFAPKIATMHGETDRLKESPAQTVVSRQQTLAFVARPAWVYHGEDLSIRDGMGVCEPTRINSGALWPRESVKKPNTVVNDVESKRGAGRCKFIISTTTVTTIDAIT